MFERERKTGVHHARSPVLALDLLPDGDVFRIHAIIAAEALGAFHCQPNHSTLEDAHLEENGVLSFVEFSLCLSRTCLGKMFILV